MRRVRVNRPLRPGPARPCRRPVGPSAGHAAHQRCAPIRQGPPAPCPRTPAQTERIQTAGVGGSETQSPAHVQLAVDRYQDRYQRPTRYQLRRHSATIAQGAEALQGSQLPIMAFCRPRITGWPTQRAAGARSGTAPMSMRASSQPGQPLSLDRRLKMSPARVSSDPAARQRSHSPARDSNFAFRIERVSFRLCWAETSFRDGL